MIQAKTLVSFFVLLLAYYYYNNPANVKKPDSPVVETLSGSLKGITSLSRDGREFYEYLGIPYAQPPVGKLRFEFPQPAEKWLGIRDASSYGSICLQSDLNKKKIHGEEDCLFLNVFIPKMRTSNPTLLPVLVWIHGGMFVFGSSNLYRPEYFMDHDIVLVTINYRLGSLGFLNTGDKVVRGNAALRDQNLALKWVQTNIKNFGGDPNQVTIFGESAGSASVHHQVLSPRSKGLFQRAISQSGSSLANWATRTNPIEQVKTYSKVLGCPTENSKSIVECLKGKSGLELMEASYPDLINDLRDPITVFNPSIEQVKDELAFIVEHPTEILKKGNFNKVPWICGINSEEGLLLSIPLLHDSKLAEIKQNYNTHMPNLIWHTGDANSEALQKIKDFYFGKDNQIDTADKFQNWTNILTDKPFADPAQQAITLQSKHSPVYAFYYSYKGDFSLTDILFALRGKYPPVLEYMVYFVPRWFKEKFLGIKPHHYGSCHFDEAALLFPLLDNFYIPPTHKDYQMSKKIVRAWVSFASEPLTNLKVDGVQWSTANAKEGQPLKYMNIDIKSGLIDEPNAERNKFWRNLKL